MKKSLPLALAALLVVCCSMAKADTTTVSFGDVILDGTGGAASAQSGPMEGIVTGPIDSIEISFDYADSLDGSWSSDYYFIITDPSGDVVAFGDGLVSGNIDYAAGVATGPDGSPNDSTVGGSFGTLFDILLATAIDPNFGEAGTYSIVVADGWNGGSGAETLGNVTVNLNFSQSIPEPTSAIACLGLAGFALIRRRRS